MKTLLTLCLLACAIMARAADEPQQPKEWYDKFSVTPFGSIIHPDFKGPVWGVGTDFGYSLNKNVSAHIAVLANAQPDWRGPALDETSVLVKANLVRSSSLSLYSVGSGDRSWVDHKHGEGDWAFGAGLGSELRLNDKLSVGIDSRIRAWFEQDKDLLTRIFFSYKF